MSLLDSFRRKSNLDDNEELISLIEHGKSLLNHQFYDRAMIEFSKAIKMNQALASPIIIEIYKELEGSGDLDGLISIGTNLLTIDVGNTELANMLGNYCRSQGNWEKAKSFYEYCLRHNPKAIYPSYNLAATLARVELCDNAAISAIAQFEKLESYQLPNYQQQLPHLWEMHHTMCSPNLQLSGGEDEEEMVEEPPEDPPPKTIESTDKLHSVQETQKSKKTPEQLPPLELEIEPEEILWADLWEYIENNTLPDDRQQQLQWVFALCCLERGNSKVARRAFETLLQKDGKNLDLHCFWLLTLDRERKTKEALEKLQLLLRKYPYHRYSHANAGYLYWKSDKKISARRHFFLLHKLLECSHGSYHIEDSLKLGKNLEQRKQPQKALKIYTPLLPEIEDTELLSRIGHLYLANQNLDDAYKIFQRILRKEKQNTTSRQALKTIREAYLQQVGDAVKKANWELAAERIEKALTILPTISALKQAIAIYTNLENPKRYRDLLRKIEKLEKEKVFKQQDKLLTLAKEAEEKKNFRFALGCYEKALRLQPTRQIFLQMIILCETINQEKLIPQLTQWFHELEHKFKENQINQTSTPSIEEISTKK